MYLKFGTQEEKIMGVNTVNVLKEVMENDVEAKFEIIKKLIKHSKSLKDICRMLEVEQDAILDTYIECIKDITKIEVAIQYADKMRESLYGMSLCLLFADSEHSTEQQIAVYELTGQALVDRLWMLGTDSMKIEYVRKIKNDTEPVIIHEMKFWYENIESFVDKVINCGGAE